MADKKSDFIILIIMGGAFLAVVLFAFYVLYLQYVDDALRSQQNTVGQTAPAPVDVTAGWNTLSNSEMGFSLKYPAGFFDAGHDPKILVGSCNYPVFPAACPNINDLSAQNSTG